MLEKITPTALLVALLFTTGVSCWDAETLPDGVECDRVIAGGDSPALVLEDALVGDCVLLGSGTYTGPFHIGAGVKLVAATRADVVLRAEVEREEAVVRVEGDPRSALIGVRVEALGSIGVGVVDGPAEIVDVHISGTAETGLYLVCPSGACEESVLVRDVKIEGGRIGLWARGVPAVVEGGRISGQTGFSLSSGYGVTASHGSNLTMIGSVVEASKRAGVLLDGRDGTRAYLEGITVSDNLGRGIWAQDMVGTLDQPSIELVGATVSGNSFVGFGASGSVGIIILDGTLTRTVGDQTPVVRDGVTTTEWVGDGVQLLDGTSHVSIRNTRIADNERAQVLIDGGGAGIDLVDLEVSYGESAYGVVTQESVTVGADDEVLDVRVTDFGAPGGMLLPGDE